MFDHSKITEAQVKLIDERRYQDELSELTNQWNRSQLPFEYLRYRSASLRQHGGSDANMKRLKAIEQRTGLSLPLLTEVDIRMLHKVAMAKQRKVHKRYKNHPNELTHAESVALMKLSQFFAKRKYPLAFVNHTLQTPGERSIPSKLLLGSHVPDIIVLGLRPKKMARRYIGIIIEINGLCHEKKYAKDDLLKKHAEEHGLWVMDFDNSTVLAGHKLENMLHDMITKGELVYEYDHDLLHRHELLLMLRAIACWLTPTEIDAYYRHGPNWHSFKLLEDELLPCMVDFGSPAVSEDAPQPPKCRCDFEFHYEAGLEAMVALSTCPRHLKDLHKKHREALKAEERKKIEAEKRQRRRRKQDFRPKTILRKRTDAIAMYA